MRTHRLLGVGALVTEMEKGFISVMVSVVDTKLKKHKLTHDMGPDFFHSHTDPAFLNGFSNLLVQVDHLDLDFLR